MTRAGFIVVGIGWMASWAPAAEPALKFERERISDAAFEAASASDLNRDGKLDIVSGGFWYAGPDFKHRHKICDVRLESEYLDDFSDYPLDVNGDGYPDIVTGGWFGQTLQWRENPKGGTGEWKVHDVVKCGPIETIRFWDVDGDGHVEAVPNAAGKVVVYKLVRDADGKPQGRFTEHVIKAQGCGHGLGFGDVNGDGRGDFIVPDGWIEAPPEKLSGEWKWHPEFKLGAASVPILVHDVDEDGRADLIVGMGHDYGLFWYRQEVDGAGARTWKKMAICTERSQYHDLMLADVDNDGKVELVTGKRYRAHNGHDPGANDPIGVYYFEIDRGRFTRVTLDYGPATQASGVGLYFWVEDVDGNGWKDIIAPGKEGLYLFRNLGSASKPGARQTAVPAR